MDKLTELVHLLTARQSDEKHSATLADAIRAGQQDEYFVSLAKSRLDAIRNKLWPDFGFIIGPGVLDDLHEQVTDYFHGSLPRFDQSRTLRGYFDWLDGLLAAKGDGYALLLSNNDQTWEHHAFIVKRADMPRVLELCESFELKMYPSSADLDKYW